MKTDKRLKYFTLMELIAALTVTTFIAVIIGSASVTFYNTWQTSQKQTDKLRQFRNIDIIMDTGVRNMIPFNWKDDETNETASDLIFDGLTDELFFVTLRRNYSKDGGALLFIRLRVDDEHRLIAEYSKYPRFPWLEEDDPDMPFTTEVLAEKVDHISFLYADKNADLSVEWLDEDWDREVRPYLPLAIRMTVVWQDGTEESWLRRTAGSGSHSVFRDREEVMNNASSTASGAGRR